MAWWTGLSKSGRRSAPDGAARFSVGGEMGWVRVSTSAPAGGAGACAAFSPLFPMDAVDAAPASYPNSPRSFWVNFSIRG